MPPYAPPLSTQISEDEFVAFFAARSAEIDDDDEFRAGGDVMVNVNVVVVVMMKTCECEDGDR